MGLSWRRSVSVGPLRLNFSRSGIGVSVGVRGARVSSGPKGTYVSLGAYGVRYSKKLISPRNDAPADIKPSHFAADPKGSVEHVEIVDLGRIVRNRSHPLGE